jgi:hypothetical protein
MAEASVPDVRAIKWWKALAGHVPAPQVAPRTFSVSSGKTLVLSVVAATVGLALGAFLLFQ